MKIRNGFVSNSSSSSFVVLLPENFDVEKHEAITEIDATEPMKGKVLDEVMKGYYLNDKIVRFAKVVVGK